MLKFYKLLLLILIMPSLLVAQTVTAPVKKKKALKHTKRDSLRITQLERDSIINSFTHVDGSVNILLTKIEDYTARYHENMTDLSRGFDTLDISQRLPVLKTRVDAMRLAIDSSTTLGYLFTVRDMIDHITEQMNEWGIKLGADADVLYRMRSDLAAFKRDTALRTAPADSSLRAQCYLRVKDLEKKWGKIDSCTKKSIVKVGLLENTVSSLSISLIDLDQRIDLKIQIFTVKALSDEYGPIWHPHSTGRLDTAVSRSFNLNYRLYKYFFTSRANYYSHAGSIALFLAVLVWIYASKRKIKAVREHEDSVFGETKYIARHPLISAFTVTAVISPYFYDHPAQVYMETMLLILMAAMGVFIKDNWPKPLFKFWRVLFACAMLYSFSNLLILIPNADRVLILIVSAVCMGAAYQLLNKVKIASNEYPPYLQTFLKAFIPLQGAAILFNISGRFSLAKIGGSMAVFNLCLAMGLYLFVQILMESLFLQLEANKGSDNQTIASYLDFKVVQKKFKDAIINVCTILWIIALTQNLDIDDYIIDHGKEMLSRSIGNSDYTFSSILIFVAVIWISGLLARVISYFYDFAAQQQTKLSPKDKKTRSSILLIRLSIFVAGFFAAIAAAGIPMTQVTIIIGALGVGIGFGLQNIVNNLVSGIILAFEKPIQVGDVIEVSGKTGTIREIGIRSSRITIGDGSELIVPNGDLISQHVINWTLIDNNRQVELIVGVAYGTDINKAEGILKNILVTREDVMKLPAPAVFLTNFSDSAVNFKLLFWSPDVNTTGSLRGRVMGQVYTEFNAAGIEIPHPKRDIKVYFPDGAASTGLTKPLAASTENPPVINP